MRLTNFFVLAAWGVMGAGFAQELPKCTEKAIPDYLGGLTCQAKGVEYTFQAFESKAETVAAVPDSAIDVAPSSDGGFDVNINNFHGEWIVEAGESRSFMLRVSAKAQGGGPHLSLVVALRDPTCGPTGFVLATANIYNAQGDSLIKGSVILELEKSCQPFCTIEKKVFVPSPVTEPVTMQFNVSVSGKSDRATFRIFHFSLVAGN